MEKWDTCVCAVITTFSGYILFTVINNELKPQNHKIKHKSYLSFTNLKLQNLTVLLLQILQRMFKRVFLP